LGLFLCSKFLFFKDIFKNQRQILKLIFRFEANI
jgi:hypothetical protein